MLVEQALAWATDRLASAVASSPGFECLEDEAAYLLAYCLGVTPTLRHRDLVRELTPDVEFRFRGLIAERVATRRPAAYLTGEAWLGGVRFGVTDRVIVPRSPLAELIEYGFAPWVTAPPQAIVDLCSGSGCLAILSALAFPAAHVDATELSPEAVAVARSNVAEHGLVGRVEVHQGDLFEPLPRRCYDVIVANPPYVDPATKASLPDEYHHEPEMALFAPQAGIALAVRILKTAARYLTPRGMLFLEVGDRAALLQERFPDIAFTWLEFERGGEGVLAATRDELSTLGQPSMSPT